MNINMKQIKSLIQYGKLTEISEQTAIPYRTLQNWRHGSNNWLQDTENKLTKLQNYVNAEKLYEFINKERIEMENKLTAENLMASYFDNDIHTLEFVVDGKTIIVNYEMEATDDEFYWYVEENVRKAVENGEIESEDDEMCIL